MRDTTRPFTAAGICLAILSLAAIEDQAPRSTFVIMSDKDTVAVEHFTRSGSTIVGDLRLPQQADDTTHYVVHLRPDGSAEVVEIQDNLPGFFSGTIAFDASARAAAANGRGRGIDRIVMAPPNSYPTIGTSIALMEQLVRATHPRLGDSASIPVINIRNRRAGRATIRRLTADTVQIACDGCQRPLVREELLVAVSKNGDIIGGASAIQGWRITRR